MGRVSGSVKTNGYKSEQPLSEVTVLGVPSKTSSVKLNGATVKSNWTYEMGLQRLNVTGLDIALHSAWQITWT